MPSTALAPWLVRIIVLLLVRAVTLVSGITHDEVFALKQDTRELFYHGFDNYMIHAFPEDELKPISCAPQTRNRDNPADIGLNDVLGNYSLTLIDSLSTLAILASDGDVRDGRDAFKDFQDGVKTLVDLYGDGSTDELGNIACGNRACGFNLDSKVQVFETNIRGVGGLLSAHLFASGELPITNYSITWETDNNGIPVIHWSNNFVYDGQMLRLAYDLASRLLPAFDTPTGLPYPRVNLRYGTPFYKDAEDGVCRLDNTSSDPREITETCAAGAGSLILEFATLSRLSGDETFERLAKRAFWAVWERRSSLGLVGNGIDAETGKWTHPTLAGIGAGIDSFYEYGLKSYILLSGLDYDTTRSETDSPESLLGVWQEAYGAVRRHVYRSPYMEKYPYYGQADQSSGAPRYTWIDNLSAYFPGLLTLAGHVEDAIESHLLFAALWTRYSALPERWHAVNAHIDVNFRHWAGRPEFVESTWYLYRATQDPWFMHVGEMVLRDIRRRCWTACGWADLRNVISGEQRDRMESFFLGETAKYLFLLFDAAHPLNHLDDPIVFSTEGHPLVIPKDIRAKSIHHGLKQAIMDVEPHPNINGMNTCPISPGPIPLSISRVANRSEFFHAGALVQLHLVPVAPARSSPLLETSPYGPAISYSDIRSPTNYTWYPWTLSDQLVPAMGVSAVVPTPITSTLTFPNLQAHNDDPDSQVAEFISLGALQKTVDGVFINSFSNLRLNMVQEPRSLLLYDETGVLIPTEVGFEYRVHGISNWALGRDEKVWIGENAVRGLRLEGMGEESALRRVKDLEWVDLVLDLPAPDANIADGPGAPNIEDANGPLDSIWEEFTSLLSDLLGSDSRNWTGGASQRLSPNLGQQTTTTALSRTTIPAILPTGPGAAPLPSSVDGQDTSATPMTGLAYRTLFFLNDELCNHQLPRAVARSYNVLLLRRGGCSFSVKLANIPTFAPANDALQLVVMLSEPEAERKGKQRGDGIYADSDTGALSRPLLDQIQKTPHGLERRNGIAMTMVEGNAEVLDAFERASTAFGSFDSNGKLLETRNSRAIDGVGLGVKRRYWFESMGTVIGNLLMA